MAERAHDEPPAATHGPVGCMELTLLVTIWSLIGAEVVTIAWNVAIAPRAHLAHMAFGEGLALVLLAEMLAYLFVRRGT